MIKRALGTLTLALGALSLAAAGPDRNDCDVRHKSELDGCEQRYSTKDCPAKIAQLKAQIEAAIKAETTKKPKPNGPVTPAAPKAANLPPESTVLRGMLAKLEADCADRESKYKPCIQTADQRYQSCLNSKKK